MARLPRAYMDFQRRFQAVGEAADRLGTLCREAGPLDPKTQELVKLGIAIGGRAEGAVHSHARRALEAGATPEEIYHVTALAITTAGFPTAVAAFTWVEDTLRKRRGRSR